MSALEPLPVVTSPPKKRVAYLDNARYWVMLLVVIGHSLPQYDSVDSARGLYMWIYTFHMPFFILISGYTARRYMGDARQIQRLVSTLIVPYLFIETTMQLILRGYGKGPAHLAILSPAWVGWFLAALVVWRLTTPIWRALRYPIATSIAISLLVGLIEVPNVLGMPKILGFLPFYVVGLHMTRERFLWLTQLRVRLAAAVVLITAFVICQINAQKWTVTWLLWKSRYDEDPLGATAWQGMAQRAELLVIGFLLTFAALSLIPNRRSVLTSLGERTFYCYLLHGYVILLLREQWDVFHNTQHLDVVATIGALILAVILANLLMTKPVKTVFRPLFEPKLSWLFRPPSPSATNPATPRPAMSDAADPRRDETSRDEVSRDETDGTR
ncbi:MAG TPA: acyltransferase family protein [Aeromicrobium sp.]|nr:acyltransferase family protein [Aeromicrobium sp.]